MGEDKRVVQFDRGVDAPKNVTVTCKNKKRPVDNLPDYVWSFADTTGAVREFTAKQNEGAMFGCIDPTYCDGDPPVPMGTAKPGEPDQGASYRKPPKGSYKFDDGNIVKYQCRKERKFTFLALKNI